MSPNRFDHLLSLVKEQLKPKVGARGDSISAEQKLLVTLKYLATGDCQQSQAFNFQLGRSTVCKIIKDTCEVIWEELSDKYLKFPSCVEEWNRIADDYEKHWNLPHVLGALDGKFRENCRLCCHRNVLILGTKIMFSQCQSNKCRSRVI